MSLDRKIEACLHALDPEGEAEVLLRTLDQGGVYLELGPDGEAFFKAETGIQETEELRKHIIKVQQEAYKVTICLHAN